MHSLRALCERRLAKRILGFKDLVPHCPVRGGDEGALHMGKGAMFAKTVRAALCAFIALFLAAAPLLLCSCGSQDQKTHVTVSVWDGSLITSGFTSYIEQQNPSYDIEWIVGDDSLDFYDYQAEHGSLPDVILTKDFNRAAADTLSDSLYDLSGTEIAGAYGEGVLDAVPGNSDGVKYLPGACGFEGIIINSYLFDLYGVEVPTSKQSFFDACKAFSDVGVQGFAAGMGDAETCYEVMQGFADASLVSETEDFIGQLLKRGSGSSVSVDGSSFDDALAYLDELMSEKVIAPDDMNETPEQAEAQFLEGHAAMLFLPNGQASSYGKNHNMTVRALPFFGDSSSWAFAQPVFVGMVSDVKTQGVVSTASDESIHKAAVDVLSNIMSPQSQDYYLGICGIDKLVSTSAEDQIELPDALSSLKPSLDAGNVRTYLPSRLVSSAVGETFRDVVNGSVDSSGALTEVEGLLKAEQTEDKKTLVSFSEGVSNLFDEARGNVAASDIAQVSALALGADAFVCSSQVARCPLYAGDKTATDLRHAAAQTSVYQVSLTGQQLTEYLSGCVSAAKTPYELPVVSGLHMEITLHDGRYHLESLTKITSSGPQSSGANTVSANEGRESTVSLGSDETYSVGISSYSWESAVRQAAQYSPQACEGSLQELWVSAYEDGTVGALPAYQDYFAFS